MGWRRCWFCDGPDPWFDMFQRLMGSNLDCPLISSSSTLQTSMRRTMIRKSQYKTTSRYVLRFRCIVNPDLRKEWITLKYLCRANKHILLLSRLRTRFFGRQKGHQICLWWGHFDASWERMHEFLCHRQRTRRRFYASSRRCFLVGSLLRTGSETILRVTVKVEQMMKAHKLTESRTYMRRTVQAWSNSS